MPTVYTPWTASEAAAELAESFTNGNRTHVAQLLKTMGTADAASVALFMAEHLTPGDRATLVNLILD